MDSYNFGKKIVYNIFFKITKFNFVINFNGDIAQISKICYTA